MPISTAELRKGDRQQALVKTSQFTTAGWEKGPSAIDDQILRPTVTLLALAERRKGTMHVSVFPPLE